MIEFRWLEAPLMVAPEMPDGIKASIPRQKILQYRRLGWTHWADVPTVTYERLNDILDDAK
jgi:hypothetical protein